MGWGYGGYITKDIEWFKSRGKDDALDNYYEVDLEDPQEIHDDHNDYRIAPGVVVVTNDDLSPWVFQQIVNLNYSSKKTVVNFVRQNEVSWSLSQS